MPTTETAGGTQPITTPRLKLRRFTMADAEPMYKNWASDPAVARWMRWDHHKDVAESRAVMAEWVGHYDEPDYYLWAITRKSDGEVMGSIGIFPFPADDGENGQSGGTVLEPGYALGCAFWGRGYASEALKAVVDYYVAATGNTRLHCCHAVENPASGRVMEKAGFIYYKNGEYEAKGHQIPAKFYVYRPGEAQP